MTDRDTDSARALLDQIEIRNLTARYNILGDRGRVAEMIEVFAPHAVFHAVGKTVTGRVAIANLLRANPTSPRHAVTRHHLTTQLIEIDGDRAAARSYFVVLTNAGVDHHGAYVDRLERIDGHWAIVERDVRLDWQAPDSVYQTLPVHDRAQAKRTSP